MKSLSWLLLLSLLLIVVMFYYSENLVMNLMCLFFMTFFLCLSFYTHSKEFWSVGLLMIITITGLFVVFTYITSISPQKPSILFKESYWKWTLILMTSIFLCWLISYNFPFVEVSNYTVSMFNSSLSNLMVSIFLIFLLLLLVIFFVRFTYNKGGSLRKKF